MVEGEKMQTERIIRLDNGDRCKIRTYLNDSYNTASWTQDLHICPKGKRTFKPLVDSNCYKYRALSMDERQKFINSENIKLLGVCELKKDVDNILGRLEELWIDKMT
tara:strand:- start:7656 stop:7976 length:321 start_codon:yes stop_codon:yes gene_type:complete